MEDVELGEKPTPADESNKTDSAPNKVLTKKPSMASTKGEKGSRMFNLNFK